MSTMKLTTATEPREFRNAKRDVASRRKTGEIEYKIAATRAEREAAFHLVYQEYFRAGLAEENPHGMRVTPYHLLPTTEMFIALHRGTVISTATLVMDGELGLPMETVYGPEVDQRRSQGLSLSEVTCLADRRLDFRRFLPVFCELLRLIGQYARYQGLDEVLGAVHPKHSRFYTRYLCFEPIAGLTEYPAVRNNPAVAVCMDFEHIDRKQAEHPERYDRFFGQTIPASQLQPQPMSPADREYFGPMVLTDSYHLAYEAVG